MTIEEKLEAYRETRDRILVMLRTLQMVQGSAKVDEYIPKVEEFLSDVEFAILSMLLIQSDQLLLRQ